MKKILVIFTVVILFATVLSGCKKNIVITTGFEDGDIMKLSGESVSAGEMMVFLLGEKESYDIGLDEAFWEVKYDGKTLLEHFKEDIKEEFISINILAEFARSKNISLSDEESERISDATEVYIENFGEDNLSKYGITKGDVKSFMEKRILAQNVYIELMEDYDVEISDEEARVMYAGYIYIDASENKANEVAAEILQKVKEGGDMEQVAEKYNYATFKEGYLSRENFTEESRKIIFELMDGQVSEVISENGRLYIIKCINDYDEIMTNSNKSVLIDKKKAEEFNKEYNPFEKDINIEYNTKLWEELDIPKFEDIKNINIDNILEKLAD